MSATHKVTNQPPPLVGHDVAADLTMLTGLRAGNAAWAEPELHTLGLLAGAERTQEWARLANAYPPVLRGHDRYGYRIDEVDYHPAWHELMAVGVRHGLHAAPWRDDRIGAHVARAAKLYLWGQVDAGPLCPLGMTYAAIPAVRRDPRLAAEFEQLLTATEYDFGLRTPATKHGLIAGMSMTEKQGGSDVQTNATIAVPAGDNCYSLTGHKWFTSAPMSDVFLTLANAPNGLSCFLLPRVLPDGSRNRMHLQRLKDKLGNRSNASAEIEYDEAMGWLLGPEGDGLRTIIEMVNLTRLDCVVGSAAVMRVALTQAIHHARHRSAFGARLVDQPLMNAVLADLAVESEAATTVAMRLAKATDLAVAGDRQQEAFRRLAVAVSKYWVCKRAATHAAEALECLGGNGYVEESGMPRWYREAPLASIWEGSGNVVALDALRAMAKQPESVEALFAEVAEAAGADRRLDAAAVRLRKELASSEGAQTRARRVVEMIALVLQGALLVRYGDPAVADAFCASRLAGDWGLAFGTLPSGVDLAAIIERAGPVWPTETG